MPAIVLLGPQRLRPMLTEVVAELGITGPIAAVTAGWEERESEDDELASHLPGKTVNLRLYHRGEEVLRADPELLDAWRQRRRRRRRMHQLYRVRLDHAMAAVRALAVEGSDPVVEAELASAFEAVRTLDREHEERVRRARTDFEAAWWPGRRPPVQDHRREIEALLADCEGVAVAGGHVGVLLDVLELFDLAPRLAERPVLAWGAGAMALGERVVLFHDNPPQGFGNAEIWGPGAALYGGLLPLPHARHRLRLDDPLRVRILARRLAPSICVPMDEGERVTIGGDGDGGGLGEGDSARFLNESGEVLPYDGGAARP